MKQPRTGAEDAAFIEWREDLNVYRPIPRQLSDFLLETDFSRTPTFESERSLLVFIKHSCLDAMESHARSDILKEQAGILCGHAYIDESGGRYVTATSALPVDTLNGPAHFTFHEKSWDAVWGKIEAGTNIVGWYHSHPGMGIFLSATDLRTQQLYFSAPWQIAIVLDPVRRELGAFCGPDGKQLPGVELITYMPKTVEISKRMLEPSDKVSRNT